MNKIKVFIATFLVMSFIIGTNALAGSATVYVNINQSWDMGHAVSRSGLYSYVYVKCESVYPTSGPDNFTKIQTGLKNLSGTVITTSTITLTEGLGYSPVYIKDGYLNLSTVNVVFRGNDPQYDANANVAYYSN